jgi:hypothetical protein
LRPKGGSNFGSADLPSFDWIVFKDQLSRLTVEKDALHVYAAFAVQVGTAFLLRKRLSSWIPWLAVLLVELVNEAGDILLDHTEPHLREWQGVGGIHDLVNTMILPTLLLLLVRHVPRLFETPPQPDA